MKIDIRQFTHDDIPQILALFGRSFGKALSREWWEWRFLENPVDQPRIALAFDGDTLVSHYAVSPFMLNTPHGPKLAALSMSTMTDAAYRSYGLFPTTAEYLYEELSDQGYVGVYGFPNNQSHIPFLKKLKWKNYFAQHSLRLAHKGMRRKPKTQETSVALLSVSDIDFATLPMDDAATNTRGLQVRPDWLAWRTSEKSGNAYCIATITGADNELAGWVIYKLFGTHDVDLVAFHTPTSENLGSALDAIAAAHANSPEVAFNAWACLNDPLHIQLEELGALADAPVTYFAGREFATSTEACDWRFPMLFSDIY